MSQGQGMAQRNESGRVFCGLNSGDARRGQDVSLGDALLFDQAERGFLQANFSARHGFGVMLTGLAETSTIAASPRALMWDNLRTEKVLEINGRIGKR